MVDGTTLIGNLPFSLPKRCVKCNDVEATRVRKVFQWHDPRKTARIGNIVLGFWVAHAHQRRGTAFFSLCRVHRRERNFTLLRNWTALMAILCLEVALFVWTAKEVIPLEILPALIPVSLATPILFVRRLRREARVLVAKHIDDKQIWLNGAGQPFLDSLVEK